MFAIKLDGLPFLYWTLAFTGLGAILSKVFWI